MGHIVVARFKLSGEVQVGVFLIDALCLGVKNAFFACIWDHEYDRDFLDRAFGNEGRMATSPACARKYVEDAVAYARGLGFAPHPDYRLGARVLGGIKAAECETKFTFGKDGKPFYIQGPNDSPAMVQAILRQLRNRCGHDGYDFMILNGSQESMSLPPIQRVPGPGRKST